MLGIAEIASLMGPSIVDGSGGGILGNLPEAIDLPGLAAGTGSPGETSSATSTAYQQTGAMIVGQAGSSGMLLLVIGVIAAFFIIGRK